MTLLECMALVTACTGDSDAGGPFAREEFLTLLSEILLTSEPGDVFGQVTRIAAGVTALAVMLVDKLAAETDCTPQQVLAEFGADLAAWS